jgi:hypothetical protein
MDKAIESVISARRDAKNFIKGSNNPSGIESNGIMAAVNNSTSVMYWGYWKKDGENDIVTASAVADSGATGATSGQAIQSSGTGATISSPIPILQSVKPAAGATGFVLPGSSAPASTNATLTGSVLISALAAEMLGYKTIKWHDQTIINYFLKPGKPGRIKYPNIKYTDVIKAGKGILAPASIAKLKIFRR